MKMVKLFLTGMYGIGSAILLKLHLTDASDVVEFMAAQLQKLPAQTQDVLKLAAVRWGAV